MAIESIGSVWKCLVVWLSLIKPQSAGKNKGGQLFHFWCLVCPLAITSNLWLDQLDKLPQHPLDRRKSVSQRLVNFSDDASCYFWGVLLSCWSSRQLVSWALALTELANSCRFLCPESTILMFNSCIGRTKCSWRSQWKHWILLYSWFWRVNDREYDPEMRPNYFMINGTSLTIRGNTWIDACTRTVLWCYWERWWSSYPASHKDYQ